MFSGIGGFSLGLQRAGMATVAFCEIEKYAQQVLAKNFPGVPIYDDIRKLTNERLEADGIGTIDVVCGGFPCQPFSHAGKRKGKEDDRDLWPEMFRVIQETRPAWVLGENVAGFVNMELERSFLDLESEGYEVEALLIPACGLDAPHKRERVWIVAHAKSRHHNGGRVWKAVADKTGANVPDCKDAGNLRRIGQPGNDEKYGGKWANRTGGSRTNAGGEVLADTYRAGCGERWRPEPIQSEPSSPEYDSEKGWSIWPVEPDVGRVAHGVPRRVDRIRGLGNAVVPQVVEIIGRAIMEADQCTE